MDYLLDFKVGLYDAGFSDEQIEKATSTILRVLSDYDVTPRKALVVPSFELVATFMRLVRTDKISALTTNELAAQMLRKELAE